MRFATLLLVAATLAWSPALAVDVEPIAKEHRPIVVTHDPGATINVLFWKDGAPTLLSEDHIVRMDDKTIWTAPAGVYAVIRQGSAVVTVNREGSPGPGPGPDPKPEPEPNPEPDPPDPDPGPEPDPEPTPGILATWAIFVEERRDRAEHAEAIAVLNHPRFRESLEDRGIRLRVFDDDEAAARPFVAVAGERRPALILMTEDGSTHRVFDAPKSLDEAETLIRENVVR